MTVVSALSGLSTWRSFTKEMVKEKKANTIQN